MSAVREILREHLPEWLVEALRSVHSRVKYRSPDIFPIVGIETTTACNRRCVYCPNSKTDRGRVENAKQMDETLFRKIIDELAEIRWKGDVQPHWYGEPLLDDRIVSFVRYARGKLPRCRVSIYTNGDYLTPDRYKELVHAGADGFCVTQHSRNVNGVPPSIQAILDHREQNGEQGVIFSYRKLHRMTSRDGSVDVAKPEAKKCLWARLPLTIDYACNVRFCCDDYFGTVEIGNVKTERLLDLWKKPDYRRLRREVRRGIFRLDLCKRCVIGSVPDET